jgi:pimeloyl-ACP methyl ester carboxylesterase
LKINQLELNVRTQGAGPLFVWGHGLMASMHSEDKLDLFEWAQFPADICLLRYDARGHGSSEACREPAAYHWAELAQDMSALAEQHAGTAGYILGGQSMGSATALYAAMANPSRVRGLILVNPPTAWQTRAAQSAFYRSSAWLGGLLGGGLLAQAMRGKLSRLLPWWLLDARSEKVQGVLQGVRSLGRCTLFNLFRGAALTDLPAQTQIAGLQVPTLILAWSDDPTHPLQTAEILARLLPAAQLHVAHSNADVQMWPGLIADFVGRVSRPDSG